MSMYRLFGGASTGLYFSWIFPAAFLVLFILEDDSDQTGVNLAIFSGSGSPLALGHDAGQR